MFVLEDATADHDASVLRSKKRFALEEFHLVTNWLVKACLLILYLRILYASYRVPLPEYLRC